MRSHMRSTSAKICVEKNTVTFFDNETMISMTSFLPIGSSADTGSSSKMIFGSLIKA